MSTQSDEFTDVPCPTHRAPVGQRCYPRPPKTICGRRVAASMLRTFGFDHDRDTKPPTPMSEDQ